MSQMTPHRFSRKGPCIELYSFTRPSQFMRVARHARSYGETWGTTGSPAARFAFTSTSVPGHGRRLWCPVKGSDPKEAL